MAENQEPQSPEELIKYIASSLVENTEEIQIETVEAVSYTHLTLPTN